ncbi:signal transduction histidine kinase [Spinactinospora alkalitolerans]|uniref:histidine kinase n=1 Tax=Spinactinospora alkalitolerans TaxID=687207 RepID=A0A852TSE9_9ACTN|nr:histidine kinase [Spinactinospora alkalitolerans]NYE46868.1 signal transduction histidine kinase [Spinactinospora alkalitolerans]
MGWRATGRVRDAWRRGWDRRHRIADACYALFYFPFVAIGTASPGVGLVKEGLGAPFPESLLAVPALLAVPVLFAIATMYRRTRPVWLLGLSVAVLALFGNIFPITLGIYSYAAWFGDRRRLAAWTGLATVAILLGFWGVPEPETIVSVILLTLVLPLLAGLWAGTRRQLIVNLRERAERLEREQHLMAEHAITAERSRIAREMHDVVAHRVSLMVLHAGGLEVSAADDRSAETAGLIRTTGREALAELREILGVLREDAHGRAPTAPQPMLSDLAGLIGGSRAAGMWVEWSTTGTPRALAAQVERTAYRVVQEALTNAAKHAPGSPVAVRVDYGERDLEAVVTNEPPRPGGNAPRESPPSSGYGLAGLRERVALAGGSLSAGPYPDGAWQVRAILPVVEASPRGGAGIGAEQAGET